jgi:hypothetical protein
VVKFNVKPKSAREYLVAKKMIQVSEWEGGWVNKWVSEWVSYNRVSESDYLSSCMSK